jgi:hypothetical protein
MAELNGEDYRASDRFISEATSRGTIERARADYSISQLLEDAFLAGLLYERNRRDESLAKALEKVSEYFNETAG